MGGCNRTSSCGSSCYGRRLRTRWACHPPGSGLAVALALHRHRLDRVSPGALPHPRGAGNNPRVLGHYVREREVIPLGLAIQKMTRLPAEVFELEGRGVIREGAWADLVVFDPERIADRATYEDPLATPCR